MNDKGYLSPLYAQSLMEYGKPLELPRSKGWLLKRAIRGTSYYDGMGCYPIFVCKNWSNLEEDWAHISDQLICVYLVADPFGNYDYETLRHNFDFALPYKEHFVIDLHQRLEDFVGKHHQRNVRKAMQNLRVEICEKPLDFLAEWNSLYDVLIERHHIRGFTQFSREVFAKQFNIPGIVVFRAVANDETVGMLLWYVQDKIAYYHLGAYSPLGYELNASFALFWYGIKHFSNSSLEWLSLGAGAGAKSDGRDGLARFKRGWATGTRQAYFCGHIFDRRIYDELVSTWNIKNTNYFPAYRESEFE
jgi:hypothetical protein